MEPKEKKSGLGMLDTLGNYGDGGNFAYILQRVKDFFACMGRRLLM